MLMLLHRIEDSADLTRQGSREGLARFSKAIAENVQSLERRPREEQRQLHDPPNRDAVLGAKPERLGAHVEDVTAPTIAQRRAFRRRRARDAALPLARRYGGVLRRRRAAYVVQW
jgi:hypothetical protein